MPSLLGKTSKLVPFTKINLLKTQVWINNPNIADLTDTIIPVTEKTHLKWHQNRKNDKSKKTFAIKIKSSNKYIGNIFLDNIAYKNNSAKISIYIGDVSSQNKGYAYDSMKTLLKYCFTKLKLHRIYLTVQKRNKKALYLYKKLGFVKEGVLRDDVYRNGKYFDNYIMSIIKSEFKK